MPVAVEISRGKSSWLSSCGVRAVAVTQENHDVVCSRILQRHRDVHMTILVKVPDRDIAGAVPDADADPCPEQRFLAP